jgi:hypothetical protein
MGFEFLSEFDFHKVPDLVLDPNPHPNPNPKPNPHPDPKPGLPNRDPTKS